jgi:hypothetical protein
MAKFQGSQPGWEAPATSAGAITPANSEFPNGLVYRALWVGGAGNVTGILADDTVEVTFSAVPAGTLLPFAFKRVSLSTTATLIVGVR